MGSLALRPSDSLTILEDGFVTLAFAFVETGYAFKRQESVLLPSIHHKTMGRMGKGRI
jgi:hypothetical protein